MPIYKKNINSYPEVLKYFKEHYSESIPKLLDIDIIEVSEDLWDKFYFDGYGYVVKSDQILANKKFLEIAATNQNYYNSLPTDEHKRDVNIYKIWKKINKDIFLIVKHGDYSSYFIIHEMAHLIPETNEFQKMKFNDEYLDQSTEQFAFLNEIRYAQQNGLSFEEYFKNSFPLEYQTIVNYNKGEKSILENYKLAKMDERDYRKMWEYVKTMNQKTSSSHLLIKMSQSLAREKIHGKFGDFWAYLVSGNTISIKDKLAALGFRWYGPSKCWWIAETKFNDYVKGELAKLGIQAGQQLQPTPQSPSQQSDVSQAVRETVKPTVPTQKTEDEEMSRWYGFPINHNIMEYDLDFEINGDKHTEHVIIDRLYVPGKDSSEYRKVKSREHKGFPKYVVRIGSTTNQDKTEPMGTMSFITKEKWGTYDENEYLNKLKDTIKIRLENSPPQKYVSKAHTAIKWHYDLQKRTDDFKQFLNVSERFIDGEYNQNRPEYMIHIDDPVYGGDYPVSVTIYDGEKEDEVFLVTALKDPTAPRSATIGSVNLYGVHTLEDFNKKINDYLNSNRDGAKESYIKYLKSFPFLPEQKQESLKDFEVISKFILNPSDYPDFVLGKIKEKGYIRPSKKQKQGLGLTSGDEIKWIVDSKKIVNDTYSFGNSPDYFYAVAAYYIHRKIRGIWSWTDMMLVDSMRVWFNVMKKHGSTFSFEEMKKAIETIGDLIIEEIYGKQTKEQRNRSFNDWFNGEASSEYGRGETSSDISDFVNFAQQYGIDPEGIKDNIKKVYRVLVNKLHPDKYLDPKEKEEMTGKFQDLQEIWNKMPESYKTAFSWYDRFVFG